MPKRLSYAVVVAVTFALAAGLSLLAASFAAKAVEENTEISVRRVLDGQDLTWAEVQADGLRVVLSGTAPDEAARLAAISATGTEVDAARVIDQMEIAPTAALAAPRFSLEILRNDRGVSISGLIPADDDRGALVRRLRGLSGEPKVTDLLETAAYPVPEGWRDAVGFAAGALNRLPRTKISVEAGRVMVSAIADSPEEKIALEAALRRSAPPGLRLRLDIDAPRPVITPFTLRFLIDADGPRFDACSADTEAARRRILSAAEAVGLAPGADCIIGLGVPSPRWAEAAQAAISALAELGGGSITLTNADVTLVAAEGTPQSAFDKVVGELDTALPPVFALHAVLPEPKEKQPYGPPEFVATLSPEGLVQLRGRLSDEPLRQMVEAYAHARFGSESVYGATRLAEGLPPSWPVRVLTGLEALSLLASGAATVTPDTVVVRGISEREGASAEIAGLLSSRLGETEIYELSITYRKPPPEPEEVAADPGLCQAQLRAAQAERKIAFEPGSATVTGDTRETLDKVAEILRDCGQITLEIRGYTDSQGREEMNQRLSQSRAQSVLNELRARRVLTGGFTAEGYGEADPIASNETEEGREANRRIEFHVQLPPGDTAEDAPNPETAASEAATAAPALADPGTAAENSAGTDAGTAPEGPSDEAGSGDGDPSAPEAPDETADGAAETSEETQDAATESGDTARSETPEAAATETGSGTEPRDGGAPEFVAPTGIPMEATGLIWGPELPRLRPPARKTN